MRRTDKKIIFILAFLFIVMVTPTKNASSIGMTIPSGDFEIRMTPEYPGANTNVEAKIVSFSFDVDSSNITWTLNGKIIEQGIGAKTVEFQTGATGSMLSLSVFIVTNNGKQVENKTTFKIVEADILWDANTYTPHFYKGKSEPVIYNKINVTAIPHGFSSKDKDLIYNWSKDYKKIASASGTGKSAYSFSFSELRDTEKIGIEISNAQKTEFYKKTITIKMKQPEILFYEENPLEGPLYQRSISQNFAMQKQEMVIRAEPFFFPKEDVENLSLNWSAGRESITPLSRQNIIGLTTLLNMEGESVIGLTVKNTRKLFQEVANEFKLNF